MATKPKETDEFENAKALDSYEEDEKNVGEEVAEIEDWGGAN